MPLSTRPSLIADRLGEVEEDHAEEDWAEDGETLLHSTRLTATQRARNMDPSLLGKLGFEVSAEPAFAGRFCPSDVSSPSVGSSESRGGTGRRLGPGL